MLTNPLQRGDYVPADHGLAAWTYDPALISSAAIMPVAGTLYTIKLKIPQPTLITAIQMICSTAGATLTAGQCFATLFDQSANQVGVTADQATAWQSTGVKDMALTAPVQVNGPFCTVGIYANGTTLPTWRLTIGVGSAANVNLATASSRYGAANTGLTTTPPATLGTITAQTFPWWVGLR